MKKRRPKRSSLIKTLDKEFSIYIRRRNAKNNIATCFACGKKDHYKNLQNGHFMSRKHYSTRWDETNCQVQCVKCNIFRNGEQFKFGVLLDKKYGKKTAEQLLLKSHTIEKISTQDLQDKIKYYRDLNKTF